MGRTSRDRQSDAPDALAEQGALDLLTTDALVHRIVGGQAGVVDAVASVEPAIGRAVETIVAVLEAGGRIVLMGAGTSGRLAVMEASEVPGTYGVPDGLVAARVAGGGAGQLVGTDAAEDDVDRAAQDVDELEVTSSDVLVAVAASGRTPYTLAAAELARRRGARVIAVTTVLRSPLAGLADVPIEVPVGDEVVAGSTRLAAGTAQKLVLNTLTTAAMVRLGHVHEHYMVDVVAANDKLRDRVTGVVAASTGADLARARAALDDCGWNARAAIVLLATGLAPRASIDVANRFGTVRQAIQQAQREVHGDVARQARTSPS